MDLPYSLQHRAAGLPRHGLGRAAGGLLLRGVVTGVWAPGVVSRGRDTAAAAATPTWVCDVLVIEPTYRTILYAVPMLTDYGGVEDWATRQPIPTTGTISGNPLVISPEGAGKGTPAQDMDGDWVVIGFLADDLNQPVILGQIARPNSDRAVDPAMAAQHYVRGTSLQVDTAGGVYVNAEESGAEIEITLDPGQKLKVLDGASSAPEPVVRATSFVSDYKDMLTDLSSALTEITGVLAGVGLLCPTTTGTVIPNLVSAIATAAASLTANGHPYLTTQVEAD